MFCLQCDRFLYSCFLQFISSHWIWSIISLDMIHDNVYTLLQKRPIYMGLTLFSFSYLSPNFSHTSACSTMHSFAIEILSICLSVCHTRALCTVSLSKPCERGTSIVFFYSNSGCRGWRLSPEIDPSHWKTQTFTLFTSSNAGLHVCDWLSPHLYSSTIGCL